MRYLPFAALLAPCIAHAQLPSPPPDAVICGQTTLTVTGASSNVALPNSALVKCPEVFVYNSGSNPGFFTMGGSAVAATTANTQVLNGHGLGTMATGTQTFLAGITSGGTTTFLIYQATGQLNFR